MSPEATLMKRLRRLLSALLMAAPCAPAAAQVDSPGEAVPPEILEHRRAALMEALGEGLAVIEADPDSIQALMAEGYRNIFP